MAEALGEEVERIDYAPHASLLDDLRVLRAMWIKPLLGQLGRGMTAAGTEGISHQEQLEAFYADQVRSYDVLVMRGAWGEARPEGKRRAQAELYDKYRHRMLHGRRQMMLRMPAPKGGVWVDLGGGTGSNLEYMRPSMSRFRRVVVVDLTPSLAEVSRRRVHERGWSSFVDIVVGDATDPSLPRLPEEGTADVVTLSYAISMIPNWKDAILNARRMLRPGGVICVCDFTVDPARQSRLSQAFWKRLFKLDHVHLSEEHTAFLQREFKTHELTIDYGGFPYVPSSVKAPFFWFIGEKSHALPPQ